MTTNWKILTWLLVASLSVGGLTFATNNSTGTLNTIKQRFQSTWENFQMKHNKWVRQWWVWCEMWEMMMWWFGGKMQNNLTDAEKTALTSMTNTEKQAFFEKKRLENEAKMEARESVIDKLLSWQTLSDADKIIVTEIKVQRAQMKAQRDEMKAVRILLDKQKAWTILTTDEQKKVDAFQAKMPEKKWNKFGRK